MILGLMRIKNEQRWLGRVLESMTPVCGRILILDDHSTDETVQICRQFPQVTVFESPFEGLNETRDKSFLMERLEEVAKAGDWIVAIDGDEQIVSGGCETIQKLAASGARFDSYRFQVLYLWDSETQIRTDGIYREFYRPSMFRFRPGARFHSAAGGGFHCGNVPEPGLVSRCDVKLLHYGYLYRPDRLRKYEWYNAPDKQPIPENEDGYRHMVVGDLFPASAQFRWGGPLQLQSIA